MNEVEKIIENIQELIKVYEERKDTYHELLDKQENTINYLIEKYKPVYDWIKNKASYNFTHPTLNYRTTKGPILGYVEQDDRLIVYDVERERIVICDIGKKREEDTIINTRYLIENGYFVDAATGLKYLEKMFERYVSDISSTIEKLNDQLLEVE